MEKYTVIRILVDENDECSEECPAKSKVRISNIYKVFEAHWPFKHERDACRAAEIDDSEKPNNEMAKK